MDAPIAYTNSIGGSFRSSERSCLCVHHIYIYNLRYLHCLCERGLTLCCLSSLFIPSWSVNIELFFFFEVSHLRENILDWNKNGTLIRLWTSRVLSWSWFFYLLLLLLLLLVVTNVSWTKNGRRTVSRAVHIRDLLFFCA